MAFYTKIIKPKEMGLLEELKDNVDLVLPDWWRDGDSLRFLYKNNFNVEKAKIGISKFIDFVNKIKNGKLKNVTLGFIVRNFFLKIFYRRIRTFMFWVKI